MSDGADTTATLLGGLDLVRAALCLVTRGRVRPKHGAYPDDLEIEDGYPSDDRVDEIGCVAIADVDRWLRDILPHAVAAMRGGHVETEVLDDPLRGPTLAITVLTGGWSGVESIIYAVIDHPIMRLRLVEQRRGGVYVFHVPADDGIARERAEVG